ncbi:MAG: serine/threonine-protein kinase, partial [Acidobacteriota bacterium]
MADLEYIGAYRLQRLLGSGGMGEVYLAFDDRLNRNVAIKRIRADAEMSPERRQRLRREAQAVAALNHPCIVQIYDILEDESGDSIVMEYVEGQPLTRLLAQGLDGSQAQLAHQVAEGLGEAHAKRLVHRDLKSDNIMVTPAGQVKILDFGLAKQFSQPMSEESLTQAGTLLGTTHSMSPEQA